jgi:hypothetical protein
MSEQVYGSLREKIAAESAARRARYAQFEEVFNEANRAGFAAGEAMTPRAMIVSEHVNPLDDTSAVKRQWHASEGACGFASVKIRPGNGSFAKWLVKNGHARKGYYGGVEINISAHGQSIERKEAHARKMAEVLKAKLGLEFCFADSRLD